MNEMDIFLVELVTHSGTLNFCLHKLVQGGPKPAAQPRRLIL